jgi:hypothetical protein
MSVSEGGRVRADFQLPEQRKESFPNTAYAASWELAVAPLVPKAHEGHDRQHPTVGTKTHASAAPADWR